MQASPHIDLDKPVSRLHEVDYFNHYGWHYYWGGGGLWGGWAYPGPLADQPPTSPETGGPEAGDPHLRSVGEVRGYHIQATDDEIGHVEDFVIDDETWQIKYMLVDTSNWWFGKKVLVSPEWIREVSWEDRKVDVDLSRETIKNGPEWDARAPIDREYEQKLNEYYDSLR